MKILAIETSCDETAVAILECSGNEKAAKFQILGDALLSQVEKHRPYGGVYPSLAKREHLKNLPHILDEALAQAGISVKEVDAIAVTAGPGLEPALWVGIEFAKKLAVEYDKPLVAVNHMEGHVLAALAQKKTDDRLQITDVQMPILALLISGGHTELVLMKKWLTYELVGQTLDDAVGEAFDKVGRMLGLPYPGGPEISRLAEQVRTSDVLTSNVRHRMSDIKLPRPMIDSNTCDFSFAGLKTAVLYLLKSLSKIPTNGMIYHTSPTEAQKKQIAHEFENAVADVLWKKTALALNQTGAKTLVIGGGVSANIHIRRTFRERIARDFPETGLRIPEFALTTDNAVMIALAGYYRALRDEFTSDIRANGNLALA
ncbi:tRNA (adenosine(37)-N6)-threonylcarbamoyltransferase complex transferase subunit TsaD [Candidatus Kaiserbacteria bacterium RIFCSPLOWO2_02_FULL_56_11]|nr:MAG: tRNA (adenosine(37)-N6)-threonylcarbamoyltransferase complex transferase subunit TsaD [Candidatus Kaiserbacteria bacterium RIFCSPLOWO2_02_FULL_56_11]